MIILMLSITFLEECNICFENFTNDKFVRINNVNLKCVQVVQVPIYKIITNALIAKLY